MTNLLGCSRQSPGAIHDLINDIRWSGDELSTEVMRRSRVLAAHCGDAENLFVIAHANSPAFFADLFAVWEAGGCAVCVNSGLTLAELQTVVEFTQPCAVLVGGTLGTDVSVPVLNLAEETPAVGNVPDSTSVTLDSPALILFTSGTSGRPKGVVHTHRSLQARIALNQAHIGVADMSRSLCVLPTHFGHGLIGNCLTPLLAGHDVFLMPRGSIAGASQLGSVIDQHQITFMSSVPAVWKVALRVASPPTGGTLSRVHIGSAPLSADLWREVIEWSGAREVVNMYGITETANWIGGASSKDFEPEDGLLGTLWGGQAAVLDADQQPQSGGTGEILLRVPSVMSSYFQRPDLTSNVLKNGWFYTGDTGSIDAAGVIRMTGRNRYAINQGGMKVYPEELDLLLERHPDVSEACAFGIQDPISGQAVAAAVVLNDSATADDVQLLCWLRENIRPDAVPKRLFVVEEIPKTDRGKLNRDNVARFCEDGSRDS